MTQYIKRGLFRKKTSKYKNLWAHHDDWITVKALANQLRLTVIETVRELLRVYYKCITEKHERKIESLENQNFILKVELKKYRDRFGIIKD